MSLKKQGNAQEAWNKIHAYLHTIGDLPAFEFFREEVSQSVSECESALYGRTDDYPQYRRTVYMD